MTKYQRNHILLVGWLIDWFQLYAHRWQNQDIYDVIYRRNTTPLHLHVYIPVYLTWRQELKLTPRVLSIQINDIFIWFVEPQFRGDIAGLFARGGSEASEVCWFECVCESMLEEAWDLRSHGEEKYSPREKYRTAETNLSDYLAAGGRETCQITREFRCVIAFICNSYRWVCACVHAPAHLFHRCCWWQKQAYFPLRARLFSLWSSGVFCLTGRQTAKISNKFVRMHLREANCNFAKGWKRAARSFMQSWWDPFHRTEWTPKHRKYL